MYQSEHTTGNIFNDTILVSILTHVINYGYNLRLYNPRVQTGSNTSTVSLRVVGGDDKGTQCLGV
jgi:hypothetical protein